MKVSGGYVVSDSPLSPQPLSLARRSPRVSTRFSREFPKVAHVSDTAMWPLIAFDVAILPSMLFLRVYR